MFVAIEGGDPTGVETAVPGEIGDDGRQQGVEVVSRGEGQFDDAEAVEQRAGQTGHAVGGGHVADVAEVDVVLKKGIWVADAGLRLQEPEQAVPKSADADGADACTRSACLFQLVITGRCTTYRKLPACRPDLRSTRMSPAGCGCTSC
jgi:hypothetical protein